MSTPTLPPLSADDRARLTAEGKQAANILTTAVAPLGLAILTGSPIDWAGTLLPLLGQLSKVVSPADVKLALSYLVALGKISAFEARIALVFLAKHAPHMVPEIDPNDPTTWYLGADKIPLEQTEGDAAAYAATTGVA